MQNWKSYLWLVKTNKGDFFFTVFGNWTLEEAAGKLRKAIELIGLEIIELTPRKRATGPSWMDNCATIYQELKPESPIGFELMGGRALWDVLGKGSEYKAKLKQVKKEMKDELRHRKDRVNS